MRGREPSTPAGNDVGVVESGMWLGVQRSRMLCDVGGVVGAIHHITSSRRIPHPTRGKDDATVCGILCHGRRAGLRKCAGPTHPASAAVDRGRSHCWSPPQPSGTRRNRIVAARTRSLGWRSGRGRLVSRRRQPANDDPRRQPAHHLVDHVHLVRRRHPPPRRRAGEPAVRNGVLRLGTAPDRRGSSPASSSPHRQSPARHSTWCPMREPQR